MQDTLARRLRVLRAERGLTLRDAEELTGVDKDTLSKLERGLRHPHDVTLSRIARGYEVPVEDLLVEGESVLAGKAEAPAWGMPSEEARHEAAEEGSLGFWTMSWRRWLERRRREVDTGEVRVPSGPPVPIDTPLRWRLWTAMVRDSQQKWYREMQNIGVLDTLAELIRAGSGEAYGEAHGERIYRQARELAVALFEVMTFAVDKTREEEFLPGLVDQLFVEVVEETRVRVEDAEEFEAERKRLEALRSLEAA